MILAADLLEMTAFPSNYLPAVHLETGQILAVHRIFYPPNPGFPWLE